MDKVIFLILAAVSLAPQVDAASLDYHLEKTHVDVLFAIDHLGFTQKHGSFRDVDGTLTCDPQDIAACQVEIVVRTQSIDTALEARDNDLKGDKFLDVAKYPEMRFVSRKVSRAGTNGLRVEGELTLHGVTKPLILDATLNKVGPNPFDKKPTLGFSAHGTLKRSDFGISFMIPMIGDEVTITIDAEFNRPAANAGSE
jgi:polyisoprenoid-binding protein YceI